MKVVHVTHEAVDKIGGIGAVIAGLVTSEAYRQTVSRTVLVGPLLETDRPGPRRLGPEGAVLYSSLDEITPAEWAGRLRPVERMHDVHVIYGTRPVEDACTGRRVEVEVLLIDVFHANPDRLNRFKGQLFAKFAVPSDRFETIWEYEEYVRLAEPGLAALKAIGCDGGDNGEPLVLLAHEYMGMPLALKAVLAGEPNTRTVFYAHEVASVRPVVEKHPGHDTMFYNVLAAAEKDGRSLEELFPAVRNNHKHALVKAARYCDEVFAVGDRVRDELRFVDRHFRTMDVDIVYNGIPAERIDPTAKRASGERLRSYAEALFGVGRTWIFTRVARPVLSKGIWRDLAVCHHLDGLLAARGETAVYFILGTLCGQRRPRDVRQMERATGWPVAHEHGYPDLCGGEEVVGDNVADFNLHHEAVRAVFVNQWGWERGVCGERMDAAMTFADLRRGTDAEFGLSVYEPFGISQLEPLTYGGICVVSNVCGCVGFARRAAAALDRPLAPAVLEADFTRLEAAASVEELLAMPAARRQRVESAEARRVAAALAEHLPRDEAARAQRLEAGYALAVRMSWEAVVRDYLLTGLGRAAGPR